MPLSCVSLISPLLFPPCTLLTVYPLPVRLNKEVILSSNRIEMTREEHLGQRTSPSSRRWLHRALSDPINVFEHLIWPVVYLVITPLSNVLLLSFFDIIVILCFPFADWAMPEEGYFSHRFFLQVRSDPPLFCVSDIQEETQYQVWKKFFC